MIDIKNRLRDKPLTTKYLTPLAVWALAFGCSVGWGAFVMPGTTFLPIGGPLGTALGLFIGAAIMMIIAVNYGRLIRRYPDSGGPYTYAKKILGGDHGFLCAWLLLLTYIAIIWANATAMALIIRYLFGDILCFGFSYEIAGYTVYMGEVLLAIILIMVTALICLARKSLAKWVQIICAVLLFAGICACFIAVLIHRGGFSDLSPLFQTDSGPAVQIIGIVILAPWAFIGFESISHSAPEFRFSHKKSLPIMVIALLTGALSYTMLTLCASMAHPDGFSGWSDYIAALIRCEGIESLPTFYSAQQAMGSTGLLLLGIAAFCGIFTGLLGNFIALSRLIYSMSDNGILPKVLSKQNRRGLPWVAICCIAGFSFFIPLLGRAAVGWIVDVTTIGAAIIYAYISICCIFIGKREKNRSYLIWGVIGAVISAACVICYLLPGIRPQAQIATESYLILIIWCLLGMVLFRFLISRDRSRHFGKSGAVWLMLFVMILLLSVSWISRTTNEEMKLITNELQENEELITQSISDESDMELIQEENSYISERVSFFGSFVIRNIYIQLALIAFSLIVVFSIFDIIRKREKHIEAERMQAEEASTAKSNFLSNMSHDIRTPMNAVIGYTELALKEEDTPDHIRDYLEKIEYSSKYLLSLINDILDMSHIESGKVVLHTAAADLCSIFDEALNVFSLQMSSKGIDYSVDISGVQDRYVMCDINRIERILLNLISNAYKFTPSGGKVTVILVQKDRTDNESGVYEFSVEDTGIGMSPEFTEHIFDAFERERISTVSQQQGTGLGMAITKSLVELMGGSITLETEQGKGTKFTITLPLPLADENDIEELSSHETEQEHVFSGKRLLVVEDNPINREIACEILKQKEFTLETAENGQDAVDMVAAAEPGYYDAVLMDIQMPVMNGYDAAKAIRAMDDSRSNVPIIALTANTFEEDRQKVVDSGMNTHIAKPFQPEELIRVIGKYMS